MEFYLGQETFKASQLINLEMGREDALDMYNQDGCINFLNQLIADDVQGVVAVWEFHSLEQILRGGGKRRKLQAAGVAGEAKANNV